MSVDRVSWSAAVAGEEASFACPAGQTLLSAMIDARKSAIKVGCRNGGCGVCRVRITRGWYHSQKMSRSRISESDEAAGIVLACRVIPTSDVCFEPLPISPKTCGQ